MRVKFFPRSCENFCFSVVGNVLKISFDLNSSHIKMTDFADIDKIFTSECSSRTVQANENGFFKNFYYTIVDSFKTEAEWKNWLKNQFGKVESDGERLQLLFNDPSVSWDILGTLEHVTEIYRKKDAMFSWQKREQVMKLLKQHDTGGCVFGLDKVLILASQAVMRAPMKGLLNFQSAIN